MQKQYTIAGLKKANSVCVFDRFADKITEKEVSALVHCPYCRSTTVGRVGSSQYYCWNCYYEFTVEAQGVRCFRIVEDGSLIEETLQYS